MEGLWAQMETGTLLMFFILLALILCSCPLFKDCGTELLFFFLILFHLFFICDWAL